MRRAFGFFFFSLMWVAGASAKLDFPTNLSRSDRLNVLEILGYGTGVKVLGDPYPLGGYSGMEIGISNEIIPTGEISKAGSKASLQGETSYVQLTFAKGLYYNVDTFLHFAPMGQREEVSAFGAGVRWGFYEAEYLPLNLSLQVAANSTGFQNKVNISTQSVDLISSFAVDDVTLFVGVGSIRAAGEFMGGIDGVTDSGQLERESVSDTRFLTGLAVHYSKMFLALEIDRAVQPNYAAKLGARF